MGQNDDEWFCFTNSKYDPATGEWTCRKEPYHKIIPD
jgi:adenylylsulfate reductase subunit A